jgi:hypothetical protein
MMTQIKPFVISFAVSVFFSASFASGQQDVRGVRLQGEASKIFEEKCLSCHNRKLIDEAVMERREMDQVLHSMEKKGVTLTRKEREVLGVYWGQKLFKGGNPTVAPE